MKHLLLTIVFSLAILLPFNLMAQDLDAPVTEDEIATEEAYDEANASQVADSRGVETYWGDEELTEVEQGFYIDSRFGTLLYLAGDMTDYSDMAGFLVGFGFGYDVMPKILSLELDFQLAFHGSNIVGSDGVNDPAATIEGDFSTLRIPIALNASYFFTDRLNIHGSLTGGLSYNPQAKDGVKNGNTVTGYEIDYYIGLRAGIEYYTGLRHFSLGLELEYDYIIQSAVMALGITPTLKYTF